MRSATTAVPSRQLSEYDRVANSIYTSEDTFDRERSTLFASAWLFACHISEIRDPGDFRVVDVNGESIIVCRDESARVRAFRNVCSHRGCAVLREPAGNSKNLRCIYHLWTYSLGGELIGTGADLRSLPRADAYEGTGFEKADFGLTELAADVRLGLVFVNFAPDPESLDEFLADVPSYASPVLGDHLEVFHLHRSNVRTNWKLFSDNNREGYHVYLHHLVRTTTPLLMKRGAGDHIKWRALGNGHAIFADTATSAFDYQAGGYASEEDDLTGNPLPGMVDGASMLLYIFPDVLVNVRSNVMRIDRMEPVSPGMTVLEFRGLAATDDSARERQDRIKTHNLVWGPFGRNLPEDILAVEMQWNAMATTTGSSSVIARREDDGFMDDVSLRIFYEEWSRRTGIAYWSGEEVES